MGLNDIYWNNRRNEWWCISEHKNNSKYNLVEQYSPPPIDDLYQWVPPNHLEVQRCINR